MRNYKQKMNKYRLPKERYRQLRDFCLNADDNETEIIKSAVSAAFDGKYDPLEYWILAHITLPDYNWAKMESMYIHCNRDTFRLRRARAYYELDKLLSQKGRLLGSQKAL